MFAAFQTGGKALESGHLKNVESECCRGAVFRRMQTGRISLVLAIAVSTIACIPSAHARRWHHHDSQASDQQSTQSNQNPLKRKLTDQERFKQQKELRNELHGYYKKWLNEDVRWIITS